MQGKIGCLGDGGDDGMQWKLVASAMEMTTESGGRLVAAAMRVII
jgi:hypothetical protein